MPKRPDSKDPKTAALIEEGTLNPSPEKVTDPKFRAGDFFDPRDLVQVRYEMLRRVSVDEQSVTQATAEFGVSRPTFYQAKASFDADGVAGLVPKKRGPRGPHKLRGEILAFIESLRVPGKPMGARKLARLIQAKFSVDVHPRTIERALGRKKTTRSARGRTSNGPRRESK